MKVQCTTCLVFNSPEETVCPACGCNTGPGAKAGGTTPVENENMIFTGFADIKFPTLGEPAPPKQKQPTEDDSEEEAPKPKRAKKTYEVSRSISERPRRKAALAFAETTARKRADEDARRAELAARRARSKTEGGEGRSASKRIESDVSKTGDEGKGKNAKRSDSKKPEAKKPEAKKADAKKADAKNETMTKPESKKSEIKRKDEPKTTRAKKPPPADAPPLMTTRNRSRSTDPKTLDKGKGRTASKTDTPKTASKADTPKTASKAETSKTESKRTKSEAAKTVEPKPDPKAKPNPKGKPDPKAKADPPKTKADPKAKPDTKAKPVAKRDAKKANENETMIESKTQKSRKADIDKPSAEIKPDMEPRRKRGRAVSAERMEPESVKRPRAEPESPPAPEVKKNMKRRRAEEEHIDNPLASAIEANQKNAPPVPPNPLGSVFGWGSGDCDQLPAIEIEMPELLPMDVISTIVKDHGLKSIAAGALHSIAVLPKGTMVSWGCNDEGALGRGTEIVKESQPGIIEMRNTVKDVTCGDNHTLCLDTDGRCYLWGAYKDKAGYIGFPDFDAGEGSKDVRSKVPVLIPMLQNVVTVRSGENHSAALVKAGANLELYIWGSNEFGQLGSPIPDLVDHDAKIKNLFPTRLAIPGSKIKDAWLGNCTTFIRTTKNQIYACGRNTRGELGIPVPVAKEGEQLPEDAISVCKPKLVTGVPDIDLKCIVGGQYLSGALTNDGLVYTWGHREFTGQGPDAKDTHIAKKIEGLTDVIHMSCGQDTTFAVTRSGSVVSWGDGQWCQIGDGTTYDDPVVTPVLLPMDSFKGRPVFDVASGAGHAIALACDLDARKKGGAKGEGATKGKGEGATKGGAKGGAKGSVEETKESKVVKSSAKKRKVT